MGSGMSDEPLERVERQTAFWFAVLAVREPRSFLLLQCW